MNDFYVECIYYSNWNDIEYNKLGGVVNLGYLFFRLVFCVESNFFVVVDDIKERKVK